jgi:hypothetical protein
MEADDMSHQNHPKESAIKTIRAAADKWPSSLVARSQMKSFSGGLYSPGTMANADSEGTGPKGAFCIGRKKVYPVESLCEWLIEKYLQKHRIDSGDDDEDEGDEDDDDRQGKKIVDETTRGLV